MFKKTLTAALAALTLTGATLTTTSSAQAGVGKFIAAGIIGAAVGGILASRPSHAYQERSYGYGEPRYRDCGVRHAPVFDEYGRRIGFRNVPAC